MADPAKTDRLAELDARFGSDPDALEWARGHVEAFLDKCRTKAADTEASGWTGPADLWRMFAATLAGELMGGTGSVTAPFDERRAARPGPQEIPW